MLCYKTVLRWWYVRGKNSIKCVRRVVVEAFTVKHARYVATTFTNIGVSMVNHYVPVADCTLKVGNWYCQLLRGKREVWLTDPSGKVFIIRVTTYNITHVPNYVYRRIDKHGFLNMWKVYQSFDAIARIGQTVTAYHKFTTKTQDIPLRPQFDSITPLTLPF